MREKANSDPLFRKRLLDYISQIVEECLPDNDFLGDEDDTIAESSGTRPFRPFIPPNHENFDEMMRLDLSDIIRSRQMHSRTHTPTCFKYGSKKCRARFPRKLVPESNFDTDTGVISIRRNHSWVNNYNKWIAIMSRANHDCQILFTKNHALAAIHYVMKYITKPEAALHSKLTVAAAVRKALSTSSSTTTNLAKMMLLKVYNKMDSYREVGVPEAISHLLDYPDHYTDTSFVNIHTTHLLNYIKQLSTTRNVINTLSEDQQDLDIILGNNGRLFLASIFNDYASRGPALKDYCLYDYCSLVYKAKDTPGITFPAEHPQYLSHRQILQRSSTVIPTLLGNLLFLNKASDNETEHEDYYCLVVALFFPWTHDDIINTNGRTWEIWFHDNQSSLSPRLQ